MSQAKRVLKTVFHERFGEVTRAQLSAYKKHNVSQSDHDDLTDVFGDNHRDIAAVVADPLNQTLGGSFDSFKFNERFRR